MHGRPVFALSSVLIAAWAGWAAMTRPPEPRFLKHCCLQGCFLTYRWRAPIMCTALQCVTEYCKPQVQNGDRKCTDVLFLLMLIAAWAAMTVLGLIVTGMIPHPGLEPGNPKRLINGIDYDGRICGVGSAVKVGNKYIRLPHKYVVRISLTALLTL